jgi:hypothetical protein
MIDIKMGDDLENFFLSVGNQKKYFTTLKIQVPGHGATFNHIFEFFGFLLKKKFSRVSPISCQS